MNSLLKSYDGLHEEINIPRANSDQLPEESVFSLIIVPVSDQDNNAKLNDWMNLDIKVNDLHANTFCTNTDWSDQMMLTETLHFCKTEIRSSSKKKTKLCEEHFNIQKNLSIKKLLCNGKISWMLTFVFGIKKANKNLYF